MVAALGMGMGNRSMSRSSLPGRLTVGLAVPLLALGVACGGGSKASVKPASQTKPADGAATTTTVAGGSSANGSSPSGAAPTGAAAPGKGGPAPAPAGSGGPGSGSQAPGAKPQMPMEVSLASACVRPGTPQTITIKATPQAGVAYNAIYADGNNSRDSGANFYGGNKGDKTNAQGVWSDTWVVSLKAVPGPVHIDVVGMSMQGNAGYTTSGFAVARPDGSC